MRSLELVQTLVGGRAGMLAQVAEDGEIGCEGVGFAAEVAGIFGEAGLIDFEFVVEGFAGFGDFVAVVDPLDGGFEAEGNEEADGNGEDVEEEVAPAVDGFVGWMDV